MVHFLAFCIIPVQTAEQRRTTKPYKPVQYNTPDTQPAGFTFTAASHAKTPTPREPPLNPDMLAAPGTHTGLFMRKEPEMGPARLGLPVPTCHSY